MSKIIVLAILLFGFVNPVEASLQEGIEQAMRPVGDWKAHTSIYIAEKPDQVVYKNQEMKTLIPASVTKVATAAAVLRYFPPGTKFKTQLLTDQGINSQTLNGNLYLKGAGDPGFVSESMWFLVNNFVRTGVKSISGDIVVDDSLFDAIRNDPSRESSRVDRAYDAPTGAMSFNWNSVNVFVRPGPKSGDPAKVFLDPENEYTELKSKVSTGSAGSKSEVSVDREETKNGDQLIVHGHIASDANEITVFKNITKPDLWSGAQLKAFLIERGITLAGKIRAGITPARAQVVAESESKPIELMLKDMDKFSNNFVAETLTKDLAALKSKPATLEAGMGMIRDHMLELGIAANEFELKNPSGFTRENKISAHALWAVLYDLKTQFQYAPEFMASLPIAGVDGTLKKRMRSTKAERWVRAKTGSLNGVVSMAGYIGKQQGIVVPFVLIYNGSADESKVRSCFDNLMQVLVQ